MVFFQRWSETDKHELILAELLCLEANDSKLRLAKCHEMQGAQEWRRSGEVRLFTNILRSEISDDINI